MNAQRLIPAAVINNVQREAEEARQELEWTTTDRHLTAAVEALADAVDQIAELLDHQQRLLVELRNWKADA